MAKTLMSYHQKKVVVTGGAGFIGSNVVRRLVNEGADVTAIDSMVPGCGGNLFNLEDVLPKIRFVKADLRDTQAVLPSLKGVEYVFSLAGNVSHQDSMAHPLEDLNMNAVAQLNLLEICRQVAPEAKMVFSGTRQIYGVPKYLPVDEAHPIEPVDINGIHKLAGERYFRLFARTYGMKTVCLRLTNTYGPRQLISHARQGFIGWFINRALLGKPIELFGGGQQIRDFCFVDDAVEALLKAADTSECYGESFNLSGERANLETIAQQLIEMANKGSTLTKVEFPPERKRIDIGDYYGLSERLEKATGWTWKTGLAEGLTRTIEYYKLNHSHYLSQQ